jgi:hypothetical protein
MLVEGGIWGKVTRFMIGVASLGEPGNVCNPNPEMVMCVAFASSDSTARFVLNLDSVPSIGKLYSD